jgi:subfamily B ATP-binding cassette protein MsbA
VKNQDQSTTKGKVTMSHAFKTIIWPKRKLVLIGLVLIAISRAASLVLPLKSKTLLDDVIPNEDFEQLKELLLIVGLAIFIQAVTSFLLTRILSVQAQYLISELRA